MTAPLAALRNARRLYGGRPALSVDSFEIMSGELIGIHGRNGGGKSTLLRVLCGITTLSSGTFETSLSWRKSRIAYCPQSGGLYGDLTLSENLSLMKKRVSLAPDRRFLQEFQDAVGFGPFADVEIQNLSDGYQKLAALAATFSVDAGILILDEPTSDLHTAYAETVATFVKRAASRYLAVIFADHSESFVAIANRKFEVC